MQFLRRGSVLPLALACGVIRGLASKQKPVRKKTPAHKADELTLATLRPGRDAVGRAIELYQKPEQERKNRTRRCPGWTHTASNPRGRHRRDQEDPGDSRDLSWRNDGGLRGGSPAEPLEDGVGVTSWRCSRRAGELYGDRIRGALAGRTASR
jgi:hypothetical protein